MNIFVVKTNLKVNHEIYTLLNSRKCVQNIFVIFNLFAYTENLNLRNLKCIKNKHTLSRICNSNLI